MEAPNLTTDPTGGTSHEARPQPTAEAIPCLQKLASRYVWWKTPAEAMEYPNRVAAQVMNLGAWEDVTALIEAVGEDYLRGVLLRAEAGQLDARSWHYWHYRLGMAEYDKKPVPPLPERKTA